MAHITAKNENGRMILTIDNLEEVIKKSPTKKMSPKEEAAWSKRLKKIVERNEYYKNYC